MFDSQPDTLSTKDKLIFAAADLLQRNSYGSVSVDDICRAANIKKGTFYHYFASKTDLALAAYDAMWAYAEEKFNECFSRDVPPLERLSRYSTGCYGCHKEDFDREGKIYGCPISAAGHEMGTQDERIRLKTKEIFDRYADYFKGVVCDLPAYRAAGDEECARVAREMFSYVLGIQYQAMLANDPEVIARDMYSGLKRLAGEP